MNRRKADDSCCAGAPRENVLNPPRGRVARLLSCDAPVLAETEGAAVRVQDGDGSEVAMSPSARNGRVPHGVDCPTPSELSAIELRYGDLFSMLTDLGFRGDSSRKTFNDYIKSLRRIGLPVTASKAPRRGRQIIYSYENVMDLALALTLRVYHVIPDAVVKALVEARDELHPIYRTAYRDRRSGLGEPMLLTANGERLELSGVFLDLNIEYAAGRLLRFGPPQALNPFQAVQRFAQADNMARSFLPIPISALAERVFELCRHHPADAGRGQVAGLIRNSERIA
ncbi:hypothetical protein E6C48_05970 [Mesorhizobium composti]|uniref:Uncharacterized protein n=1 Tax=Ollibium composti TaxID=2675109 RepID=A0ABY2QBB5_9HYPH|nr:hypothetical protein E6C48_05970 [Mesorhizobium composti]